MEKLRTVFENNLFSCVSDSILFGQYFEEEIGYGGKVVPARIQIRAIATSFDFYKSVLSKIVGFSRSEDIDLTYDSRFFFIPPPNRSILITITYGATIIEILCNELRISEDIIYQEIINPVGYKFLSIEQEQRFPNLREILNITLEKDTNKRGPFNIVRELNGRPELRINKIELLESEQDINNRVKFMTKFPSKLTFISKREFEAGEKSVIINSEDRTAIIIEDVSYEKYKKCGWEGTVKLRFTDEYRYTVTFHTYYELCSVFNVEYIFRYNETLLVTFNSLLEFSNLALEIIHDEEGY